jgi:lactoylglutathione lyase
MIRVQDIERSKEFYCELLGLQETHRMDFPAFSLVYLCEPESGFEVELTLNKNQTDPYTHGTGYGHLAFCSDDLETLHQTCAQRGFRPGDIKTLTAANATARFFFMTDPDGYKIEVLERGGHYV